MTDFPEILEDRDPTPPEDRLDFRIGDYGRNVESGWLGKIVAFERDPNGDTMARMIGVDVMATHIAGLSREESLSADDVQWHDPRDLNHA